MAPQQLARGVRSSAPRSRGPGRSGRARCRAAGSRAPARGEMEDALVVLAVELVEPGVVEVAHPAAVQVDRLGDHRALDVIAAIARRRRVGEEPRVELDDDRPAVVDLLGDLDRQRPVGLHLVDVDPEERLEILGRGLEERPLVALEVGSDEAAERRERLVAVGVEELDHDVHVAVGLEVGAARCRGPRAAGRSPCRGRTGSGRCCSRGAHSPQSSRLTSSGHASGRARALAAGRARSAPARIRGMPCGPCCRPRGRCRTSPAKCSWW